MKKIYTEKEIFNHNQHQAFRLRQLFLNKKELFDQMADYLPFSVYLNKRKTLDTTTLNKYTEEVCGEDLYHLKTRGHSFVREISDPYFLASNLEKIKSFEDHNDPLSICSYTQNLKLNGIPTFLFCEKVIIDADHFLNFGYKTDQFGKFGKLVENLFSEIICEKGGWEKFRSLTRQEKKILILLAKGMPNKEVADRLFISALTVKTHRNNINKKLGTKHIRDLIRYAQALELL